MLGPDLACDWESGLIKLFTRMNVFLTKFPIRKSFISVIEFFVEFALVGNRVVIFKTSQKDISPSFTNSPSYSISNAMRNEPRKCRKSLRRTDCVRSFKTFNV